jgi:hypothetical protein
LPLAAASASVVQLVRAAWQDTSTKSSTDIRLTIDQIFNILAECMYMCPSVPLPGKQNSQQAMARLRKWSTLPEIGSDLWSKKSQSEANKHVSRRLACRNTTKTKKDWRWIKEINLVTVASKSDLLYPYHDSPIV